MGKKDRPGRSLEKLVETLERALSDSPRVQIESPKMLRDSRTGKTREHDVVLTIPHGVHTLTVAIECRDRSRKLGVDQVEAFRQKCLDTGVSRGVLVSPKGFWKTARQKAADYGIECLNLEEAASFDWLAPSELPMYRRRIESIQELNIFIEPPGPSGGLEQPFVLRWSDGTEITPEAMNTLLRRELFRILLIRPEEGTQEIPFRLVTEGMDVVIGGDGAVFPVTHLEGRATLVVERQATAQFQLVTYGDTEGGSSPKEIAVAEVGVGPVHGQLVISMGEDEGSVRFLPKTPEE